MSDQKVSDRRLDLDDLAVGQRYLSPSRLVTAEDITRFAQEFDPQPFHLDDAAAARTFFGSLAASGWHTAAITMRLLVDGGLPLANGVIGSGGELAWQKPVRPGDRLTVETEILEIVPSRSKPVRAAVRVMITTRNQDGETVQTFAPRLVVDRLARAETP